MDGQVNVIWVVVIFWGPFKEALRGRPKNSIAGADGIGKHRIVDQRSVFKEEEEVTIIAHCTEHIFAPLDIFLSKIVYFLEQRSRTISDRSILG